ncbi:MAG: AbrB/MazE/SpoVT family DNA-binding domain-containing protein [Bacillota bacterium]
MKSVGITRKVDQLGRVVLPKELRKTMGINKKDSMEIFVDEDKIIFKKYDPGCTFCDNVENTIQFKGKTLCEECIAEFNKMNN